MYHRVFAVFILLAGASCGQASQGRERTHAPIIDVHLHAEPFWEGMDDTTWFPTFLERAPSTDAILNGTIDSLRHYNVVRGIVGDAPERISLMRRYRDADPNRIVLGVKLDLPRQGYDSVRAWVASGEIQVLGEVTTQYMGYAANDPALEPLWQLAEEFDIPVGIHVGLGPRGAAYTQTPRYRMSLSNALLLEDVLVRHRKLRLYVMHAGWPRLDEMVGLLHMFPNVYVDVGAINWLIPRAEFHAYLRRLMDAGFGKQIMFGSDQMEWPGAIGIAVRAIESASFLTHDQRRDIFCNNAARFFRLDAAICALAP